MFSKQNIFNLHELTLFMKKVNRNMFFAGIVALIMIVLFLISSYLTKTYTVELKNFIGQYYYLGIFIYLFLGVIDAMGIPVSNVPLLPVVSTAYGFFMGVLLTSVSWFVGSVVAFRVARKYGVKIVKRFISLNKLESFQKYLPESNFFFSIIFFRILMPHDFVNYGYGIFTKVKETPFLMYSAIGIVLSVFIYSTLDKLSLLYQVIIIFVAIVLFYLVFYYLPRRRKNK